VLREFHTCQISPAMTGALKDLQDMGLIYTKSDINPRNGVRRWEIVSAIRRRAVTGCLGEAAATSLYLNDQNGKWR